MILMKLEGQKQFVIYYHIPNNLDLIQIYKILNNNICSKNYFMERKIKQKMK
jgi:hypothetical protein